MALRDQLRVMVVDDMSTSRGLLVQALEAFGIKSVAHAADGPSALAAIQKAPDVIVLHIQHNIQQFQAYNKSCMQHTNTQHLHIRHSYIYEFHTYNTRTHANVYIVQYIQALYMCTHNIFSFAYADLYFFPKYTLIQ